MTSPDEPVDTSPSEVQAELDHLLGAALELAEQQLTEQGAFYPFAIAVNPEGEGLLITGDTEVLGETPSPEAVREHLHGVLIAGRDGFRSIAVAADVLVDGADAVRVELEHHDGVAVLLLAPYSRDDDGVTFADYSATAAEPAVWA